MKKNRKKIEYEFNYDEISEILHIPRSTVKQIEKEALLKIGVKLEELGVNLE